ncbi:hypothetical protein HMPREF9413_5276 [Paenibacillus sp. HGF7]|nr:hypothetical protein HMPREF9413_5276 [Paenibacillus sp. HGF7]
MSRRINRNRLTNFSCNLPFTSIEELFTFNPYWITLFPEILKYNDFLKAGFTQ